ncbi:MAG: trigger factor [Bacteroidales bacterium]|jgi:trigger factor|nr:trigger factor [Bacteroidales bacterium]
MNIVKENNNDLTAVLKVNISKDDYAEKVENVMKDYRKKARIDGFRPGKVPMGLVQKMYGKGILIEEVNKLISNSLTNYIRDEKLNLLGEPLPNEDQTVADFDKETEFEFKFDVALAPEIEIKLSKKDKVPFYDIKVNEKLLESHTDNYTRKFGQFLDVEEATDNELLTGNFIQLDDKGGILENGIKSEDVKITIEYIKDADIKATFAGKKVGDNIVFDVRKAYPSDSEIASMLKIDKEIAKIVNGDFQFDIKVVQRFDKAEINQELFDKAFGKDVIKSDEEFKAKMTEEIKSNFVRETDYRFMIDAKQKFVEKINPELPTEFLQRWLTVVNEGKFTAEQIKEEYPKFEDDLKWQLIKDQIIRDNEIKVEESDVLAAAKEVTAAQFAQYGLGNLPDEQLEQYAKEILKKDDEKRKLYEKKFEDKVVDLIKNSVKLDTKEVTVEEFQKLWEEEQKKDQKKSK